ncbi:DUF6086 family protein [Streptomyces sp. NBC_01450]|uniref:DUF6086 family protein n=1 Tax=Streptomyces sp. NBC_01450 TaxID=2903871 RepID=UPI002E3363DE|nr:DUF6086 family protein [Streptomyces sp. NBC_01450]
MSQDYYMDDETLWNPSNGASRLFLRQVALFEAELELPSGIGPMVNDESRIDRDTFAVFVDALLARHRRTSHAIMLALSEGFAATVLVLAERGGVAVDWARLGAALVGPRENVQISACTGMSALPEGGAWESRLRERSRELGRSMAR